MSTGSGSNIAGKIAYDDLREWLVLADRLGEVVYADGLDLDSPNIATPIGANCRLCEREDCNQRALPPLNRRLAVSEYQRGLSPFAFARD